MPSAKKLRSEAHLQVRRNDEVAAQRRRWTFYEAINFPAAIQDQPLGERAEEAKNISFFIKNILTLKIA